MRVLHLHRHRRLTGIVGLVAGVCVMLGVIATSAQAAPLKVHWMAGYRAPGTPAKYDKVGVLKIGSAKAKNVLVLEPGTSAGSAYFVPLARWLVSKEPGWQVWSVERRENLLEDQSELNLYKQGKVSPTALFNYYLGYLSDPSITHHIQPIPDSQVGYARQWGLKVAVEDLHTVINAAQKLGGKVVLGGHSLGGSVVTGYAAWNFNGKPGADQLAGLVYDDGGSLGAPVTASAATQELQTLQISTPWLAFSGVPAPYLGLFSDVGAELAIKDPNAPSLAESFPALPSVLKPPEAVTNQALFGYDTDVKTSKLVFAAQAHLGSLNTSVSPARWNQDGAITPIDRYAAMLSGSGINNVDGTEWYFPQRLTDDTGAINEGIATPAQKILDVDDTMGRHLPKSLRMYAFGAYGGTAITQAAVTLAKQSHISMSHLTLVVRHGSYAHNDPAAAYPHNVFFNHLVTFLKTIDTAKP